MKNSLNQKAFKIHGSHEQVAGSEPLCLQDSTKEPFSALNQELKYFARKSQYLLNLTEQKLMFVKPLENFLL